MQIYLNYVSQLFWKFKTPFSFLKNIQCTKLTFFGMNYYCEYYSIFIQSLRDSLLEHAGKINADTQPVIVTQVQSAPKINVDTAA